MLQLTGPAVNGWGFSCPFISSITFISLHRCYAIPHIHQHHFKWISIHPFLIGWSGVIQVSNFSIIFRSILQRKSKMQLNSKEFWEECIVLWITGLIFVNGLFSKQNTVFEKLDLFLSGHKFCQKELILITGLVFYLVASTTWWMKSTNPPLPKNKVMATSTLATNTEQHQISSLPSYVISVCHYSLLLWSDRSVSKRTYTVIVPANNWHEILKNILYSM